MCQQKQIDASEVTGYCDCCGKWSDDLPSPTQQGRYCFSSCPKCDGREKERETISLSMGTLQGTSMISGSLPREGMLCKCCGQYSSAQYCWYCTERLAGRDPVILENIRLQKELEQAQKMARVCLDLHKALGVRWGDNPYPIIKELKNRIPWD